ncbi:hypothetical protein TCAL_07306 [Tigriopus californicus]|uniref:GST C-terminal domain-containing protein n=1 Tax=Tigriopus californicus TaxID=6832 RepID=A0A553PGZ9_TIGCA|nr:failed axon connections homolog [Tigriopus californicus]TRY76963.1 hypothetical protein TCAL_07306 [Tigriopus californicus]|eukprot:TCALIF_07306-PA protein Name:"Similar to faxc Failed axon connections homolog (Xenopus tropicalis)" AED:0.11 eAED:0.11 QI:0/-1/0/1/-1/1/1/0/255
MPKSSSEVEKGTVILHQFERARTCPSPSPYPIKLETFLRMAKIKYVNDFKTPMSPKGKCPWIALDGTDVADSQLAMEHLKDHFQLDLSAHLSPEEKAINRGMRSILEDHLYFTTVMERWVFHKGKFAREIMAPLPAPKFLQGLIISSVCRNLKKQCVAQGLGRHTQAELEKMTLEDVKCLSDYLGDKPYLMGDKPTEIDCVLFGFTCMAIYATPEHSSYHKCLMEDFQNLKLHNDRIKSEFWPDWDECKWIEKMS